VVIARTLQNIKSPHVRTESHKSQKSKHKNTAATDQADNGALPAFNQGRTGWRSVSFRVKEKDALFGREP
jgi:hypothetical protein